MGNTWGIKYGDSNYSQLSLTTGYCALVLSTGRILVAGSASSGHPILYSDYVEAGAGIVESGSNSNGSWIKFDDGTMIEWFMSAATLTTANANGNIFYVNSASLTFPAAFIANPNVSMISGVVTVGVPWAGGAIALSATAVTLRLCGAAANNAGYYGYIAIGKWK
jgi:hypothetical protein